MRAGGMGMDVASISWGHGRERTCRHPLGDQTNCHTPPETNAHPFNRSYPQQSVREEYLAYQGWDTVQALCSYLRGILTTKAILEGSGVGSGKWNWTDERKLDMT